MPDFDIAIVGGGPAGAATALFLCAEEPALASRIVVLDRSRFPRDKICAGAIGGRADVLLDRVGIRVEVESVAIRGLEVVRAGASLCQRHPRSIGRVVRRHAFDAALLDRVRERGVTVMDGVGVSGLRREATRVTLHTDAGDMRVAAVIGADGVGSVVRRSVGFARGVFHAQAVEVDTGSAPGDPARDVLSFDVSDASFTGYAWDFPTVVAGEPLMCRGVYVLTRGVEGPRRDAAEVLRGRLAARGLATDAPFKRFAERGLSLFEPIAAERVLLVGEAAGIDPVLGEGIPQAIFYGHAAARYLAESWRRRDFRFAGYARALRGARVGVDLRIRGAAVHAVYGRTRPKVERWLTSSNALASAGMSYFAGEHVSRAALFRAALDFVPA